MNDFWSVQHINGAVIARFKNPPMNYFIDAAIRELESLIDSWSSTDARAIVFTGEQDGKFITHFSADEIRAGLDDQLRVAEIGAVRNHAVNRMLDKITRLEVPVIAAMNGDTMGFGYELSLACDFRIGQRGDFRYGLPEARLGIIPGSGGTQRLVRLVGLDRALDIVMRGRIFTPEKALEAGLITELCDSALEGALQLTQDISRNPRLAVASAKRALHLGFDGPLATGLAVESDANLRTKLGPDVRKQLDHYLSLSIEARRDWIESGESV